MKKALSRPATSERARSKRVSLNWKGHGSAWRDRAAPDILRPEANPTRLFSGLVYGATSSRRASGAPAHLGASFAGDALPHAVVANARRVRFARDQAGGRN